ncbi:MAG TPA: enoyl-CoA hydratase/isomerase family protein [Solirubrobacterales bacterium]|nr:enoyl-CoA hydratase/isomerase family protein [Solirubrobacterales bacterium]
MGTECVRRDDEGPLAIITIDHPPLNLFDRQLIEGLTAAVDGLAERPPRAALIRAEGKVVSAGVDVHLFAGTNVADGTRQMAEMLRITHAVEALDYPVVFSAHGLTLTAAFELALACDMIVAGESARFGLVEATVGLSPGMGGTQRLTRIAGPNRARELVMSGEIYPAATLEQWGVVNAVHPDEALAAAARGLAGGLAAGPTLAHGVTKRVIRAWDSGGGTAAADRVTAGEVGGLYGSEDFQGGVRSLLDAGPGKAEFNGR